MSIITDKQTKQAAKTDNLSNISGSNLQDIFQQNLSKLAISDPKMRQETLLRILNEYGFSVSLQTCGETEPDLSEATNYVVSVGDTSRPHLLFCAHYDAYPGSCGANDNAAALCVLIELARMFSANKNTDAEFAFFDGEESGRSGSRLYVSRMDSVSNSISGVINLDVCGYGNTIAVYSHSSIRKPSIRSFCGKAILAKHHGKIVKYLPESDNISFQGNHIPTLNIAMMPEYDISFLQTLSGYANSILGKPPEFQLILGQMEVMSTMHCNSRDKISSIEYSAMLQLYHYLADAVCNPQTPSFVQTLLNRRT